MAQITIESPNLGKITKEAGPFTANSINTLWNALNDTRATERRDANRAQQTLAPDLLTLTAAASVNDQNLGTASIVCFVGAAAENLTGFKAPQTGEARILFVQVSGAGTITIKSSVTSETANQIVTKDGADYAMSTGKGVILCYLASKWREIARTG